MSDYGTPQEPSEAPETAQEAEGTQAQSAAPQEAPEAQGGQPAEPAFIAPENVVQGQDEGPDPAPRSDSTDEANEARQAQDHIAQLQDAVVQAEQALFSTAQGDPEYDQRADALMQAREELRAASRASRGQ